MKPNGIRPEILGVLQYPIRAITDERIERRTQRLRLGMSMVVSIYRNIATPLCKQPGPIQYRCEWPGGACVVSASDRVGHRVISLSMWEPIVACIHWDHCH